MHKDHGRWVLCPACFQILYTTQVHKCPEYVLAKRNEFVQEAVVDEMTHFNEEIKAFWNDPHTKFLEHLADKGDI